MSNRYTEDDFLRRRTELSASKQALLDKWLCQQASAISIPDTLEHCPDRTALPLSFAQLRLWFLQQLEPDSPAYNEPVMTRISGPLNIEALTRTVREITRRHEVLRSTFKMVEGYVTQFITPPEEIDLEEALPLVNLGHLPALQQEQEIQQRARQELLHPFDLTREWPCRTVLLRLNANEHVQITIMHHLVTDAWSMANFFHEVSALYEAYCSGSPSPLAPLQIQYGDYARWQQQRITAGYLDQQLAYWKLQLGRQLPVLALPTNHSRPMHQGFQGHRCPVQIPQALGERLQSLSRQEGATMFMTLLAAFQILLSRYSQQEEIAIGTPIAGRVRPELETLIGCFVNTLVLRVELPGSLTFRDALRRVKQVTLEAYDHQEVPFEKLVEELHPERDLSHNPLFQVMFVWQNAPIGVQELAGVRIAPLELESQTAKFDLSLCLQEEKLGIGGYIEYSSTLFEHRSIERMVEHLLVLLKAIVANPDHPIRTLSLLSEQERWLQLSQWNNNERNYPLEISFDALFQEQVKLTPKAIAVKCEGREVSYQELNERAERLANALVKRGVRAERVVGVLAERGVELLSGLLGINKAGGAYLPLDPHWPLGRLSQVLIHSQPALILATQGFTDTLMLALKEIPEESRPPLYVLEGLIQSAEHGQEVITQLAWQGPAQTVYIIYTSGSTGAPKGVIVEHRGMLNHLCAKVEELQLSEADAVAQTASQSFDISIWQMLAALLVGGQVCIYPDEVVRDPERLLEAVARDGVSILEVVPSLLQALLDEREGQALSRLRWLIATGEALPAEVGRRWIQQNPSTRLLNAYGPTECSDDVTHFIIEEVESDAWGSLPLGRPLANLQVYVLDTYLEPMPIGVLGEIYVGGAGVGRGYIGEADLTAQAYLPDPHGGKRGGRLYRTGDIGRYRADGVVEYIGRVDQQVKVRGYRIELAEIEATILKQPGIQKCVVLVQKETPDHPLLVAYIVLEQGFSFNAEETQHVLRESLPEYMIPSAVVQLEALPLTPNGKLDRQALPLWEMEIESEYIAPRTPLEEHLAEIWAEVLQVERVGILDDFFALGGHSLLIMKVESRIRENLQVQLPVRVLFKKSTIEKLSKEIEQIKISAHNLSKPEVMPLSREAHRKKRSDLLET